MKKFKPTPYVSPYAVDERTRRSVLAARGGDKRSINEVHQHVDRRPAGRTGQAFRPVFDEDSFLNAVGIIEGVVEGLCVAGGEGWEVKQRLVCEKPRTKMRLLLRRSEMLPVIEGVDRATNSLYDPIENLECMLEAFLGKVEAWATKSKYFKEVTVTLIARTIENSTSEASTAEKVREALDYVGPIDASYVNSFEPFSRWIEAPILGLRALGDFIASILNDGDEVALPGGPGASGGRGSVETKSAPTPPTSSAYFNTILNAEPAAHASTSGHANTERMTTKRSEGSSAFADLLQAAGEVSDSNVKPPSPRHESKRESPIDLEDWESPSYSPPASPSLSLETLLDRDQLIPNIPSSLLSRSTPFYNPSPASVLPPPGVPAWKIDLNARKGHPIHTIHVGPRELAILSRCHQLVHKATLKGEECARVISERHRLATEMQEPYEEWEDFCKDLEDNVKIEKVEKGVEREDEDPEDADDNDHDAWFGTSDSAGHDDLKDYGRLGPNDGNEKFGYRKFDAPASSSRRLDTIDENRDGEGDDDEETETETEDRVAVRARSKTALGARARSSRHGIRLRMKRCFFSPSASSASPRAHDNDGDNGTVTKTRKAAVVDERVTREDVRRAKGSDAEMQDVGRHDDGEAGDKARGDDDMEVEG